MAVGAAALPASPEVLVEVVLPVLAEVLLLVRRLVVVVLPRVLKVLPSAALPGLAGQW